MSNFNVRKLFFKKGKLNPIGALYVFIFSGISIEILIILRKLESDNYILKQLENNIFIYYFSVIGIMSLVVFLFLSARKIPSIISRVTLSQVLLGLIVMLLVGATSTTFYYKNQARKLNEASSIKKNAKEIDIDIKGIGTTEILLATTPTLAPKPVIPTYYVDPDPVISCGPGQNSGQYVKDKRSNCINYVDCELNNNTYSLMLKSECDTRHAEDGKKAYPTCFVFGKTYQVSPETCKYYQQEEARINNIGTVHSFALTQIIIPYIKCVNPNFPATFRIATNDDRNSAKVNAFKKIYVQGDFKRTWQQAEFARKKYVDRRQESWLKLDTRLRQLIETFEEELHNQGLIDFDDMPLIATRMVIEHEWIRKSLFAKFPILFVDEYQDLGSALHELVLQLCFTGGIRLFAVGDPDQSIYRFTGANPDLLKQLSLRSEVKTIKLPFNYRCGTSIIEASKAALGEDRDHKAPDGAAKGIVIFDPVEGELPDQARHITNSLIPSLLDKKIDLKNIAVLYRNKADGDLLAAMSEENGIPVIRSDGNALIPRNNRLSRFIEACAQWVTGGWKTATPSFRRLSYEAASLVYGNGYSEKELEGLEKELMSFLLSTIDTDSSTHEWLLRFNAALIEKWRLIARTMTDEWFVVEKMIDRTNGSGQNKDMTLPLFCGRTDEVGRLNLSTLHSSKGREFDVVIMYGMNKGTIPNTWESDGSEDGHEARRLFYVGVTRAKGELHMVFKKKHYSPWVAELYRRLKAN